MMARASPASGSSLPKGTRAWRLARAGIEGVAVTNAIRHGAAGQGKRIKKRTSFLVRSLNSFGV